MERSAKELSSRQDLDVGTMILDTSEFKLRSPNKGRIIHASLLSQHCQLRPYESFSNKCILLCGLSDGLWPVQYSIASKQLLFDSAV
jgi:hypothetical protein